MNSKRFNPRSGIVIFVIAVLCNVVMLHQWLSSACCQKMVSCQSSMRCSTSGCYDCVKTPVMVGANFNDLVRPTINIPSPIIENIEYVNQEIWHPPKERIVFS